MSYAFSVVLQSHYYQWKRSQDYPSYFEPRHNKEAYDVADEVN